jgi:hypothetical protein
VLKHYTVSEVKISPTPTATLPPAALLPHVDQASAGECRTPFRNYYKLKWCSKSSDWGPRVYHPFLNSWLVYMKIHEKAALYLSVCHRVAVARRCPTTTTTGKNDF